MRRTKFTNKLLVIAIALLLGLAMCVISFGSDIASANTAPREGDIEVLAFTIDTGDYVNGITATNANLPVITLELVGENPNFSQTSFWYIEQDTISPPSPNANWSEILGVGEYNTASGVGKIYMDSIVGDNEFYSKYIYFKSVVSMDDPNNPAERITEEYIHPQFVDMLIDTNYDDGVYAIQDIQTTYTDSGASVHYDTSNPHWVSTQITFKIISKSPAAKFWFSFQKDEGGKDVWLPATDVEGEGYSLAVINETHNGLVKFSSSNMDSSITQAYDGHRYIMLDTEEPQFSVKAEKRDMPPGTSETDRRYVPRSFSATDVEYTITPIANEGGSGAMYYYYTGETMGGQPVWNEMSAVNNVYTLIINSTTKTLQFKGVSGAGKEGKDNNNYETNIDKVTPKLKLVAIDGKGNEIRSAGTSAGGGYKVGFATDRITFTLTNENVHQNTSKVVFEYMIDNGQGEENYQGASQIAPYDLIVNEAFVGRKYKFRARSEAGLTDTIEFTVSVLKSDFSFEYERDIVINTNTNGWAKDEIPVYFKVPAVLNTDDEYIFYSQITGNATSVKRMDTHRVETFVGDDGVLYSTYLLYIDRSLDSQTMDFYADNKAGDRSPTLTTYPIKLDLVDPFSKVERRIYDSTIILAEDEWADGRVVVEITPTTQNRSGLRLFPLLGNQRGREIIIGANGIFSYQTSVSGVYRFVLVSGADRTQNITVNINIDSSEKITFDGISAYTKEISFDSGGNEILKEQELVLNQIDDLYTATRVVSRDVFVNFSTNHSGHFTYYYQSLNSAESAPIPGGYTHITDLDFFLISISDFANIESGSLHYAFYLESKAVNKDGIRKISEVLYLSVAYNIRDFSIEVTAYTSTNDWVNQDIDFAIDIVSDTPVDIREYQMRLIMHDGTDLGWRNITVTQGEEFDGAGIYTFGGIELYTADGRRLGEAFNGKLMFRAINTAGKVSSVIGDEINIKLDKTTPDPIHAIKQSSGGEIVEVNLGEYNVFSNTGIALVPTFNNAEKPIFGSLAPITYYYANATGAFVGSPPPLGNFVELTAPTQLAGNYWVYASNTFGSGSTYKFNFNVEVTAPTATLSADGAAIGVAGIYEFNWNDIARVSISAFSDTAVYYWYKIGATGSWIKYNTEAKAGGVIEDIIFVGEYTSGYPNAIVGNMDETVEFRVTNLAGSTASFVADAVVRIRIDVRNPEFDFITTSNGEEIDRSEWQPNEVFIKIFPVETVQDENSNDVLVPIDPVTANPGGVQYQYRLNRGADFEMLPGDGTFFSTSDLATAIAGGAGFDGNGMVTIEIRATAKESGKRFSRELTLYIDTVAPTFELLGEITIPGTANTASITSGTWTNADEIRITKNIIALSKSPVSYTYTTSSDPHNIGSWDGANPLVRTDITTLYVTARNGAGLTVTRAFDVKIDNVAPIINSGIIRNAYIEKGGVVEIDRLNPNTYYIDQAITYIEPNLKYARFNNFTLPNGHIVATNTVDNSNTGGLAEGKGGYVHIVVEDMAGNKAELIFYMTEFELTINTITLSEEHKDLLSKFEEQFEAGKAGLTQSRRAHFESRINRLNDRLATLEKQVNEYRAFLLEVNNKTLFTLIDDYRRMEQYINYFETADETILYPQWQQDMIKQGEYGQYYDNMEREFRKLEALMTTVLKVEQSIKALPPANVVKRSDYPNIRRVYDTYDTMSGIQKEMVTPTLYVKLTEVKKQCEILLLQDESTGSKITGEGLTPGLMIEVLDYDKTVKFVSDAQKTLLEQMPEGTPRAIVYVRKLGFEGYGTQYETGDMVVTLPIPEEYQNYIGFGVYRLSTDGRIIPVDNITISNNGRSLYFPTTSLDTYILAVNAQPTIGQESEKIYGVVGDVEINATLLTYITYAAVGMFAILLIVVLFIGFRHRIFLRKYNKSYKDSLTRKGINKIPKGNPPARTNPAEAGERMDYAHKVYQKRK